MRTRNSFVLFIALAAVGCGQAAAPPDSSTDAARAQAELSADPGQAKLWQEVAERGGASDLEAAVVESGAVRKRTPATVEGKPIEATPIELPEAIDSGLAVLALPQMEEEAELITTAQVAASDGQFLTLDLGDYGTLQVQAKIGGRALRAAAGETAQVRLRRGTPFERNDFLTIQLERDQVLHALVGGTEPVRISAPELLLEAAQFGEPEGNAMAVSVQVSRAKPRILRMGEETEVAGLTVAVLASVAVQGDAAYALPGEPYRLEILAWRSSN